MHTGRTNYVYSGFCLLRLPSLFIKVDLYRTRISSSQRIEFRPLATSHQRVTSWTLSCHFRLNSGKSWQCYVTAQTASAASAKVSFRVSVCDWPWPCWLQKLGKKKWAEPKQPCPVSLLFCRSPRRRGPNCSSSLLFVHDTSPGVFWTRPCRTL